MQRGVERAQGSVEGRIRRVALPDQAAFIEGRNEGGTIRVSANLDPALSLDPASDTRVGLLD
jgi:hypothetical protein